METETVLDPALAMPPAEAVHAIDMSPFALFMQADWVVKSVMLGLLAASIVCWAIIFSKLAAYARARAEMRRFEKAFAATSGSSNWSKILLAAEIINPWKYTSMTLVMKV